MSERRVTVYIVGHQIRDGIAYMAPDGSETRRFSMAQVFLTRHDAEARVARADRVEAWGGKPGNIAEMQVTEWGEIAEKVYAEGN